MGKRKRNTEHLLRLMAHEIKNPAAAIVGFSDILLTGDVDGVMEKELLKRIRWSASIITKISDDIATKSSPNTPNLPKEEMRMCHLIKELKSNFMLRLQEKNISFKINCSLQCTATTRPHYTEVEYVRLQQVFINLINNAIKFTPEDGKISVVIYSDEEKTMSIRVEDTGIGIPEEELENIFEYYYKLNKDKGSGLGLGLCKNIIEKFGGEITVKSELNNGSAFTVKIPTYCYGS